MISFKSALVCLLLLLQVFGGCRCEQEAEVAKRVQSVSEQIWSLSERIYKEVAKSKEQFTISAVSIFTCVSMLLEGATNDNEKELLDLLKLTDIAVDERRAVLKSVMTHFNQVFKGMVYDDITSHAPKEANLLKTSIANSIWVDQGFSIKPSYQSVLKEFYQSDSFNVNMGSPATLDSVNNWIKDKTEGLIPKALSEISREVVVILVNTVYFYARWMHAFETSNTRDEIFHLSNGRQIKLPFMHKNNIHLRYWKTDDGSEYVELPYQKGGMSMIVKFGKHATTHPDLGHVRQLLASTSPTLVNLAMPKFDFKTDIDLKKVLQALGVKHIFAGGHKGFDNISDQDLLVSQAIHQSRIKVNEQGTEAAAVTIMMMSTTSVMVRHPHPIKLDHPFSFLIYDRQANTALFSGAFAGQN